MHIKRDSALNRLIVTFLNGISIIFKTLSLLNLKLKSFRQKKYPEAFIVSIDNLSFGGTGKTTLVAEIALNLEKKNIKFAVVTRGYKSEFESTGVKVLPHHNVKEVGDEAGMLKRRFPHQDIYVGRNRRASIERAIRDNNKIILLDDGFQTTGIYKDLKIMLVNPRHPYYYLRNFKRLVKNEDYIFFYKQPVNQKFCGVQGPGKVPVCGTYDFEPGHFYDTHGKIVKIDTGKTSLLGFSALGDNARFKNDLSAFKLVEFKGYSDHYNYTAAEIEALDKRRIEQKADYLVCTEKDFIKLEHVFTISSHGGPPKKNESSRAIKSHIPLIYFRNSIKFSFDLMGCILKYAEEKNYLQAPS